MIVVPGPPTLVDREALATLTGRSRHTIRKHCTPVRHRDGRPLYDLAAAIETLAAVPTRR